MCSNTNCTQSQGFGTYVLVAVLMTLPRIRVAHNFDLATVASCSVIQFAASMTITWIHHAIEHKDTKNYAHTTRKLHAFWDTLTTWWPVLAATVLRIPPQLLACEPDIGARTRAQVHTAHNHKILAPSGCDFDDNDKDPRCTQL